MIEDSNVQGDSVVIAYAHGETSYAVFAAGCFWGVQHEMDKTPGVIRTFCGYEAASDADDIDVPPTYEQVKAHHRLYIESVLVEYDPAVVSYEELCKVFFEIHDPSQTDGIGPDIGPQYRSVIYYRDSAQETTARAVADLLRSLGHSVATQILPERRFWIAEPYHQDYYARTGGTPYCHIRVRKF